MVIRCNNLEGLQFTTTLDLNMGYYKIQLGVRYKEITTIVTKFGKFQYNVLPMIVIISEDVFQAKLNKLLG